MGANLVAAVAIVSLIGVLGDRFGRQGAVVGVFLFSSIAVLLHGATSALFTLLLARFLIGIHAVGTGLIMAIVSDLFGKGSARYMGYLGAATTTGWILAPLSIWHYSVTEINDIENVLRGLGFLEISITLVLWAALARSSRMLISSGPPTSRRAISPVDTLVYLRRMPPFVFTAGAIFLGHAGVNSTMGPVLYRNSTFLMTN